ncbi:PREDICTED: retinol dehydrogenase 14 [Polistes dominula]|uniref:Retinol dehydrogenase 14 n=1 Tax=Polistes dominula TaxID=743375 RepID=A0ABM1I3Q8_POLDO|nr:PREDICTED: retinol dehydrogenase 14 [Polistes dominula]XP_015174839.1 PREDICTED: retinol dehydrogenase 14 [Polistes dominula]XP_015174840.1 PREDICTED: retinol dehydrogenase 14 [Polistes dominula]XP_015174841.1 PREDICTED: retinol dehydrogenase 14 [Polistes dominula]XP_015174842.1 PREDICTED: retinol dehydrogenase 14 [Polistes dominula]XP_015174843.1 PREDICTED: retinol dehydrogenase 14 [Polistes dominula]XP_015174844.1 PREDICTED: retinol dehydrogenase 14 [Polistes dominula]XP_015174845.1 PRE
MKDKTVIITGCTSGLGKETTIHLAKKGAKVIMACRNIDVANTIKEKIIKETGNSNIIIRKLDLTSLQSIRNFAELINKEVSRLDVLIHNAALAHLKNKISEDGLEVTMATNHYGPFLLTHLLIDLLKKSKPSRIVIVSSVIYKLGSLNLNNPNQIDSYIPCKYYFNSKYANLLFTLELARRLEGTGVIANCLHPGVTDTGIWKRIPCFLYWICKVLIIIPVGISTQEGVQRIMYLVESEEINGLSGQYFIKYFNHLTKSSLTNMIGNPALPKKFWEISEELVKLQPTDPKI